MTTQVLVKSRLEVNFIRLIEETQHIANGNKPKDWKFAKIMRKITILYGSQTGCAQDVAERISRESKLYHFDPTILSMNEFSINNLEKEKLAIFVASTTGQGHNPDNMNNFFQSLWQKRTNKLLLKGLNYAVLGLGDSSYQKFNFASKRLNKLLCHVGASPILDIGLADDQHDLGTDFVVDSWLTKLWTSLLKLYPLPEGMEPITTSSLPSPKFEVKFVDADSNECITSSGCTLSGLDNAYSSVITLNLRKTAPDHFQDVRLIEFELSSAKYSHKPGDVVMLQPENLDEHVDEFIDILQLDSDKSFFIIPNKNAKFSQLGKLPQPCTIRQCVKYYFDILSIPRRYFFKLLSHFTTDENERERFLEFNSSEGQQDLYDYCNRPKRSILEVLADFPHTKCNIPFEYLFDLIPPMRSRAYSIASSAQTLPGKIQILVAVVKYKTTLKRIRMGVCSNWLAQLCIGSVVPLWINAGTLNFPNPGSKCPPVIMISPGTGCAPFRAYIQERIFYNNFENLCIIFGCRGRERDFFFRDEWEKLGSDSILKLFCAFSRDQEEKIYIQHIMKKNFLFLWELIQMNETQIYYAGNAKQIPIDVYEALQYICERGGAMDSKSAEQYMKRNLEKRYQTESWA